MGRVRRAAAPGPDASRNPLRPCWRGLRTSLLRHHPVLALTAQGNLSGFNAGGLITATVAGALGAAGAACIIWAFRTGGLPVYVMPLVFGGAPLVNVLVTMVLHPPKAAINPMLYVGFLLASAGAGMVLYFRPTA